ncbi:MAG: DUF6263 family protein [Bacteroidota bacterium]|nr:DUF6263 family protein [Bacteroidota bacterium]
MKKSIYTMIALGLVLIFQSCDPEKTELAYQLEPGKQYFIDAMITQNLQQELMQGNMDMSTDITAKAVYDVVSKNDDVYEMNVSYTGFDMDLQTPQGEMHFGTSVRDTNDMFSALLRSMTENEFLMKMTEKGEILSVDGIEKMFEKMMEGMPGMSEMEMDQLKKSLKNIAGEESFKGNFGMGMPFYPEKAVRAGDTWSNEISLKSVSIGTVSNTWELVEVKGDQLIIHGEGQFVSNSDSTTMAETGIPMTFDMTGPVTYDLEIDKNTGWVTSGNISQQITGTVSMQGNPQMPQGMEMKMTVNTDMKIEGGQR